MALCALHGSEPLDKHAFKQRIIGAIVLVALAVIFIPILLPGHRDLGFIETESHIPAKPAELENLKVLELEKPIPAPAPREIVRTPIDEQSPPAPKSEQEAPADETKPVVEKKPAKSPDKEPKPASTGSSKAWVVQVGSFSKRDNAMRLRDQLRTKGYNTFVEQISSANKTFYRVRVGPVVSRNNAEALQKELQTKMKLEHTKVMSHP